MNELTELHKSFTKIKALLEDQIKVEEDESRALGNLFLRHHGVVNSRKAKEEKRNEKFAERARREKERLKAIGFDG